MFTLHSDGDSELDHELAGAADLQAGRLADRPPNRVSVICSSATGPGRRARPQTCSSSVQLEIRAVQCGLRTERDNDVSSLQLYSIGNVCHTPARPLLLLLLLLWRILWLCPLYREPTASCGLHRRADKYLRAHESDKLENGTVPSRAAPGVCVHN